VSAVAEGLEAKNIMYGSLELSDCSGMFHRFLRTFGDECPGYALPEPRDARDSRDIARWYERKDLFSRVRDELKQDDLIRPGAVMFYGQRLGSYGDADLEEVLRDVEHVVKRLAVLDHDEDADAAEAPSRVLLPARATRLAPLRARQEQELLAVGLHHVVLEALPQEAQAFVGSAAPLRAGHAEGLELGGHPAHAHAEAQPAARELLDRRHRLRGADDPGRGAIIPSIRKTLVQQSVAARKSNFPSLPRR